MKSTAITLAIAVICSLTGFSQQLSDSLYNQYKKPESLEILDEHLTVELIGAKIDLMRFSIIRDVQIVVRSKSGIDAINDFLIPETFDQYYIQHAPSLYLYERLFDNVKIDSLALWVKRNKQEVRHPARAVRIQQDVINSNLRLGNLYAYRLSVNELVPGDTIRLFYSVNFPFIDNADQLLTIRMFHHSKWSRKRYQLNWKYNGRLEVDTVFHLIRPEIVVKKGIVDMQWNLRNLPGALDEPNCHPYVDLPWFVFTPKPFDFLVQQYSTFEENYLPAWMIFGAERENDVIEAQIAASQGIRTSDYLAFNKLADSIIAKCPDDLNGRKSLTYFQKFMVSEVRYDKDLQYYRNKAGYLLDKPGRDLQGRLLRDRNRVAAYANMILRLGFRIMTAYPMDKRCGQISPAYFPTILDGDFLLLTILKDTSVAWIYPKSDKANYFCDEMPFYFENTQVMLQNYMQRRGYKRDMDIRPIFYVTPNSKPSENFRKINSSVSISFKTRTASFQSRVSLSGQFSTMTRNIYRGIKADSTINPKYNIKVSDIGKNVNVLKSLPGMVADSFPFLTSVATSYEYHLPSYNGDTLTINLSDWIKHITVDGIDTLNRVTSFYSDFCGYDRWSYMIRFDEPFSIVTPVNPVELDTDYGQYAFNVKQVNPEQILVTSYFLTKSAVLPAEKIDQVAQLFNTMSNPTGKCLKVVKVRKNPAISELPDGN